MSPLSHVLAGAHTCCCRAAFVCAGTMAPLFAQPPLCCCGRLTPVLPSPSSAHSPPTPHHQSNPSTIHSSPLYFSVYIHALAFSAALQRTMHIQQACNAHAPPALPQQHQHPTVLSLPAAILRNPPRLCEAAGSLRFPDRILADTSLKALVSDSSGAASLY